MAKFISNPSPDEMPRSADVIVIGGGPAGTAALWALERFAPGTQTVLIEQQRTAGRGQFDWHRSNTIRTCWPALPLARQMQRSVEVFHHADDYLGEGAAQSLALKQRGYLFCAFNERRRTDLQADVRRLHDIGLTHIEYLDADEVRYRFGWLGERVIAAKYDPIAGWLDSNALIYKYAQSATSAQILLGVPRGAHVRRRWACTGVATPNGKIAAPNVVIAAGANAQGDRAHGGRRTTDHRSARARASRPAGGIAQFPEDAPMMIGAAPFPHVRPEARERRDLRLGIHLAQQTRRATNTARTPRTTP